MKNILGRMLGRYVRTGEPMRGSVNRVSVIATGELSVVVRFGMDEPRAQELKPGTMIEVVPTTAKRLKGEVKTATPAPVVAQLDDPLAAVRWICPKCSTVNGIEDAMCVACSFDRPTP
jgi:hypothetical protein